MRNILGNVYLSWLTKNLWYEQREQLDSGGGGTLSQGAGLTEGFMDTLYSRAKTSSSVHQNAVFTAFLSETADKFAKDYAIKKASVMPCTLW